MLKLKERGMLQDIFPDNSSQEIIDLLNSGQQCVYAGFDPTAQSLHIGNLLVLVNLLHWQRAGQRVVALVGGATGLIGDPSGRTNERIALAPSSVNENSASIVENIRRIFNNHEQYFWKKGDKLHEIRIVNNYEWYSKLNAVDLVGQIGRHFRMGTMLSRQSVQSRLTSEGGMSFTEFCYQIFQAYDWLQLLQTHDCRFQVGGNDQMGNIMSGHDLISRLTKIKVYGLTLPLITSESGDKFGKSSGSAVWLDSRKTSPFQLYQFFIRVKDSDVGKLLKLFSFEPPGTIDEFVQKHQTKPELRIAQKKLAEQVTLLVHGEEGLHSALQSSATLYEGSLESLGKLNTSELSHLFEGATVCELLLEPGTTLLDLALRAKCFATEGDARRIISAGGFYINQQRATNIDEVLSTTTHILPNNVSLVRVGGEVKEGFGNQINLCRDRGLNLGPPAQKSDTLPLDHQIVEYSSELDSVKRKVTHQSLDYRNKLGFDNFLVLMLDIQGGFAAEQQFVVASFDILIHLHLMLTTN
uniref:Tyrosine--tRNA ligase n=1 Tax=Timema bartmani TaxID=61472 RepID=A0A7R9ER36_9NEOP|nr:unnamed protein product [Timema bartmani]